MKWDAVCRHDPAAVCANCSDQVHWWREARIRAGIGAEPPYAHREQVSLRYEQQRDEQRQRAEAAEAALVRAREALERIAGLFAPAPNRERMQEIARAALEATEVTK